MLISFKVRLWSMYVDRFRRQRQSPYSWTHLFLDTLSLALCPLPIPLSLGLRLPLRLSLNPVSFLDKKAVLN